MVWFLDILAWFSCSKAIDRDSGINEEMVFKVAAVQFIDTNNQNTTMRNLFEAVTTQQKDIYVGIIQ